MTVLRKPRTTRDRGREMPAVQLLDPWPRALARPRLGVPLLDLRRLGALGAAMSDLLEEIALHIWVPIYFKLVWLDRMLYRPLLRWWRQATGQAGGDYPILLIYTWHITYTYDGLVYDTAHFPSPRFLWLRFLYWLWWRR
jgi:hypothetical protein